jgi:hypothetical protein
MKLTSLVIAATLAFATPAAAWIWGVKGNDTGGIIPWAYPPPDYRGIAMNHCGWHNKVGIITSVPRQYGDYAGFICVFPHGYDPVKQYYGVTVTTRG